MFVTMQAVLNGQRECGDLLSNPDKATVNSLLDHCLGLLDLRSLILVLYIRAMWLHLLGLSRVPMIWAGRVAIWRQAHIRGMPAPLPKRLLNRKHGSSWIGLGNPLSYYGRTGRTAY
jgi:hypothetical protein